MYLPDTSHYALCWGSGLQAYKFAPKIVPEVKTPREAISLRIRVGEIVTFPEYLAWL